MGLLIYAMNAHHFIEEYNVPVELCKEFIEYHKQNTEYKSQGAYGNGAIDKSIKDSTDVFFYNNSTNITIKKFFKELSRCVEKYTRKYNFDPSVNLWTASEHNIQHYAKGGGYKILHYERAGNLKTVNRQLVYMLYCNTVKNGGTEFPFQKKVLKAKQGKLVIWPSDFTHPHRGIVSLHEEKYNVTGWLEIV